jgi:hypothetical protein
MEVRNSGSWLGESADPTAAISNRQIITWGVDYLSSGIRLLRVTVDNGASYDGEITVSHRW